MSRFTKSLRTCVSVLIVATGSVGMLAAQAEAPPKAAITGVARPAKTAPAPIMPLASHRASYRITLATATGTKSPDGRAGAHQLRV